MKKIYAFVLLAIVITSAVVCYRLCRPNRNESEGAVGVPVSNFDMNGNDVALTWNTEADMMYRVYHSETLAEWKQVFEMSGTGSPFTFTTAVNPQASSGYFKVMKE
jgi:hypothetical protein